MMPHHVCATAEFGLEAPRTESESREEAGFDLVVADASWTWTERLFSPMAELGARVLLLKACDWRNALQQGRPAGDWTFPRRKRRENLWEQTFVLPPGWMKTYPRLGMRPLAWGARGWRGEMYGRRPLGLVICYPHYLYLRDLLRPSWLIYYNMDDYGLYWGSRRETIQRLERRAVREADLSVFCARVRADQLRAEVPSADSRIIHLPHGAPAGSIAARPQAKPGPAPADIADLPRPLLGFVGSLEDRIDWPLVGRLADAFPNGSIVLVGQPPASNPRQAWNRDYSKAVARPNVHTIGWRGQDQIGAYNAAFDVCLIPYKVDHAFNRASCPTKVMDYMATSRPVVTTAVPECRLYHDVFDVAENADEFFGAVSRIVEKGSDDGKAHVRWELARSRTWERTTEELLTQLLERVGRMGEGQG